MEHQQSSSLIDDPEFITKYAKEQQLEVSKAFANTFNTDAGQKVLGYLSIQFFSQSCFDPSKPDASVAVFKDGQRSVVKFIIDQLASAQHE